MTPYIQNMFTFGDTNSGLGALIVFLLVISVVAIILGILYIVGLWKTLKKAGKPGWGAIVPFYSLWLTAELGDKPGYWSIIIIVIAILSNVVTAGTTNTISSSKLLVVSASEIATLIILFLIYLGISKNFGKGVGFAVLLLFFPYIGFMILGVGSSKYKSVNK